MRQARVERVTTETRLSADVTLDGGGRYDVRTGIGFLDHMLEQLARHSLMDLRVRAEGDLHIDFHHTVEDSSYAVGTAMSQALAERRGIRRYGCAYAPNSDTMPGWIGSAAPSAPIVPDDPALKVPHMGWNRLSIQRPHQVLAGLTDNAYFIHSFHVQVHDPDHLLATTDYGTPLAAVIGRGPCVGTQFHPEKSQGDGLRLIDNFLRWMP